MTNEEAIEFLECCAVTSCTCGNKRRGGNCPGEDVVIEALKSQVLKMAIKALEKQIPKRPDIEGDGYDGKGNMVYDTWICPCCEKSYEVDYDKYEYCPCCGQHIDRSYEE